MPSIRARAPLTGQAAAFAIGVPCLACSTTYRAMTPHVGRTPGAALEARQLLTLPPSTTADGAQVEIVATTELRPDTVLTSPQLSSTSAAPCSGGIDPIAWGWVSWPGSSPLPTSTSWVTFPRQAVDREGLLWSRPTSLDVKVLHTEAPADCLRVPLVVGGGPEWSSEPRWSFGMGFRAFVPLKRIYGVDGTLMAFLRAGRWLGPVRLRVEAGVGGAAAHQTNANLVGYSFGGGVLADSLVFATRSFGIAAVAGYDLTGISYSSNIDSFSHAGAGFAGFIHGPRAGLALGAVSGPAPGPAFRARRDASSFTFEMFGAALWSHDRGEATPALWFTLAMDGGLP